MRYVYAMCDGALWRFTRNNWRALLLWRANGREALPMQWGTLVSLEVHNITDLTPEQAEEFLNE